MGGEKSLLAHRRLLRRTTDQRLDCYVIPRCQHLQMVLMVQIGLNGGMLDQFDEFNCELSKALLDPLRSPERDLVLVKKIEGFREACQAINSEIVRNLT